MAEAVILDQKHTTKYIESSDFAIAKIVPETRIVKINEILPFRVKFTSIGIEGYSSNNVPPIPLQVIGYSNYIL